MPDILIEPGPAFLFGAMIGICIGVLVSLAMAEY